MAKLPTRQRVPARLMTAEEFSELDPDLRAELVRGRVVPLPLPKPRHGVISVLRSPTDVETLGPDDMLSGDDVLPGFSCPVAELV